MKHRIPRKLKKKQKNAETKIAWVDLKISERDKEFKDWQEFLIKTVCAAYKIPREEFENFQATYFGVDEAKPGEDETSVVEVTVEDGEIVKVEEVPEWGQSHLAKVIKEYLTE